MKLSVSNIGWEAENDVSVYEIMKKYGYSGLEIAPTRIFPDKPYDQNKKAKIWSGELKSKYNLDISSMQSIWFGRQECIFGAKEEREVLMKYTKKAIDFAAEINCGNLVFGCPRNRNISKEEDYEIGVAFFRELGEYAFEKGTIIGMEANPTIYHTNYINDTNSALELIKEVNSKGFLLNLDIGTMIQNEELPEELIGNVKYINHVHISEPNLKILKARTLHKNIKDILLSENYNKYVSIEMGKVDDLQILNEKLMYVKSIFGQDGEEG